MKLVGLLLLIACMRQVCGQDDHMVSVLDENTFLPVTRLRFDGTTYKATAHNWLVLFQASWCAICKSTMPTWIQLSEVLGKTMKGGLASNIRMGVVDSDMNYALTQQFLVEGYPTFLYITKEGVFKFQGRRTVEGFIEFLQEGYLKSPRVEVKELSITNLLLQLYRKIGLMTVIAILVIATWLGYLCSGIFLKTVQDPHPAASDSQRQQQENQQNKQASTTQATAEQPPESGNKLD